jgi:hypothetical protein
MTVRRPVHCILYRNHIFVVSGNRIWIHSGPSELVGRYHRLCILADSAVTSSALC